MKIMKIVLAIASAASFIFLLYGCMRLAKIENNTPQVMANIPGVTVELLASEFERNIAIRIASISGCAFVISLIGFGTLAWIQRKSA